MGMHAYGQIFFGIPLTDITIKDSVYERYGLNPYYDYLEDLLREMELGLERTAIGFDYGGEVVHCFMKEAGYNTIEFDPKDLTVTDDQKKLFKTFCSLAEIDPIEPRWFLCSLYG